MQEFIMPEEINSKTNSETEVAVVEELNIPAEAIQQEKPVSSVEEVSSVQEVISEEIVTSEEVAASEQEIAALEDLDELLALGEEVFDLDIETAAGEEASNGRHLPFVGLERDGLETIATTSFETNSFTSSVSQDDPEFVDSNVNLNLTNSDALTSGDSATGSGDTSTITVNTTDSTVIEDSVSDNVASGTITVSDVDSDTTLASSTANYGSVVVDSDGNWTYTLDNSNAAVNELADDEVLTDTITFVTSDGTTATQDIVISGTNDLSVVTNDTTTLNEDASVDIDVLANDTDIEGNLSAVASVTDGANGVVSINDDGTVTYTPNADFNGADSFTYTNTEGTVGIVDVTVDSVNDLTVVVTDAVTLNEDASIEIDVLANDTDLEGDVAVVSSVTDGANGSVSINENGTVTYTPNADFNGADSFTYTNAEGTIGIVNVTVDSVNDLTIVADDSATLNEDASIEIDVLANDTDVDGIASAVSSVTDGTNGSVSINENGTVTYTPNANFNGIDSFTYTNEEGATATVNVTVDAVNDLTVANTDAVTLNEDASVVIDVLANDTDVEGNISAVASVTNGANGTVTINDNGTVTYTPNANFNGTDSFTYTNTEGTTATVDVTVDAVNDLTVTNVDLATLNEDASVEIDVLANDTDIEGDISAVVSVTNGANGSVSINDNGTVTYTPNADFNGADSFTYTNAEGTVGIVSVTVDAVNDLTVVNTDTATLNEDASVEIDVLANDTDAEGDISEVASVTNGANGSVTINDNGTVTYTPNANFNGADSFTYTNAEGTVGIVSVTVDAVNDLTVVNTDTASVNEDASVEIDVLANDTDIEGNVSEVASVTNGSNGSVAINNDGTVTYTPNANFNGTDSFTYTNAEGVTGTVNVTVDAVNDLTVVVDDTATLNEDASVEIDVLDNDTDIEGNVSAVKSVTDGANGTVTINDNGTVTYTPEANFNGTDSFTYTNAEGVTGTVNVTVDAVNDLTVVNTDTASVNEDASVEIDVLANDTDIEGNVSAVKSVTDGANGTVTINDNGTVTYTPEANFRLNGC